jgi:hypothetical protein
MFNRKAHVSLEAFGIARKTARLHMIESQPVAAMPAAR